MVAELSASPPPRFPWQHHHSGVGCFVTGSVKRAHRSHSSKPAPLPEIHLYLGSAALVCPSFSFFPSSFLSQTNSRPSSLLTKASSRSPLAEQCGGYLRVGRIRRQLPALGTDFCQGASLAGAHAARLRSKRLRASSL